MGTPVKLLSIDGGGVRGFSALFVLKQIVDESNHERSKQNLSPQDPWEMFEMIGGTSTGGLIAIMLGRLQMSVDECLEAYKKLSMKAFTPKTIHKPVMGPRFKTEPLEDAIRSTIGENWNTELLKKEENPCKVFVVAHSHTIDDVVLLRSYRNHKKSQATYNTMLAWQACRATSAALTFFESITIDGVTYGDGALIHNNPVEKVHSEANDVFPGHQQIMISLGTGLRGLETFEPSLLTVPGLLAKLATETEKTARSFHERDGSLAARAGRYFRFNVPGIGEIGLEKVAELPRIQQATERYVDEAENREKMELCIQKLSSVLNVKVATLRKEVLNWISDFDFKSLYLKRLKRHHPGTGQRFLESKEFQDWSKGTTQSLCCTGIAGAGKSTLMAFAVSSLQKTHSYNVIHLFLDRTAGDEARSDEAPPQPASQGLLRSLLRQLLELRDELPERIASRYADRDKSESSATRASWPELLQEEATRHERIRIVLDGLDEVSHQTRFELMGEINELLKTCRTAGAITSTRDLDMWGSLLLEPRRLGIKADSEDIKRYATHYVQTHAHLSDVTRGRPDLHEKILERLCERANGMFLLPFLALEMLEQDAESMSKSELVESLNNIPELLGPIYERFWRQMTATPRKRQSELARQVMMWISHSHELMPIDAFLHAIWATTEHRKDAPGPDDILDANQLVKACLGIVVANNSGSLDFMHNTAREFYPAFLEDQIPDADLQITKACLKYLGMGVLDPAIGAAELAETTRKYPFVRYAALNWGTHARQCEQSETPSVVLDFLSRYAVTAARILVTLGQASGFRDIRTRLPEGELGPQLAAFFGLDEPMIAMLSGSGGVDVADTNGWTPLRWACCGRQPATVQLLLQKGARTETEDADGQNVLLWAMGKMRTHLGLPDLRWRHGLLLVGQTFDFDPELGPVEWLPDPEAPPFLNTTYSIVTTLIDNAPWINAASGKQKRTVLSHAAENQQFRILDRLLARGCDVDVMDPDGMTPLLWILNEKRSYVWELGSVTFHEQYIFCGQQLFFGSGPDDRGAAKERPTRQATARRLVGRHVNATNHAGRTALSLAAEKGYHFLVSQLLELQADKLLKDEDGKTPLDWVQSPYQGNSHTFDGLNTVHSFVNLGDRNFTYNDDGAEALEALRNCQFFQNRLEVAKSLGHIDAQVQDIAACWVNLLKGAIPVRLLKRRAGRGRRR